MVVPDKLVVGVVERMGLMQSASERVGFGRGSLTKTLPLLIDRFPFPVRNVIHADHLRAAIDKGLAAEERGKMTLSKKHIEFSRPQRHPVLMSYSASRQQQHFR